jgi:hypothetical protein
MSSPLSAVLGAVADGAASRLDVAERTGLARDVTDAAIDHLVRMGRLDVHALGTSCPGGACGSCPSGNDGAPGCETSLPSGPVLLQIGLGRVAPRTRS